GSAPWHERGGLRATPGSLMYTSSEVMRVDTEAHVVSGDQARYPLNPPLDFDPMGTARSKWYDAPGLAAEDLLGRMDATGIDRAVLVQAFSSYQDDNSYTADAAAAHPA